MSEKATDYLGWEEYFMALACLAAQRSKDPNTKVGACIVNHERRVVALGYNGMPNGCSDDVMPWGRVGDWEETKFPFVCHAEMNAIMNKTASDLKDCTIYSTLFPCNECAKLIIQAGINNVVFLSDKHHTRPNTITARRLFDTANIKYCQLLPKRNIVIDFKSMAHDCSNNNDSSELLSLVGRLEMP